MRGLLMLSVLLATALPRVDGQAGPQLATMIELSSPESGPSVATLYFNDQSVMLESGDTQVFVLNSEAMLVFNRKEKSYAIQTYEELRAAAMYKANELAHSKD